jgi:SAM-dependent methyltransferase
VSTSTSQGHLWADDWATAQEWLARPAYDAILDELAPWLDVRLLDLGCGSGGFASLAAARGAVIAGVDISPELIEIAERRVPDGAFRVGDMTRLPYADGSFGAVTGLNSFQYVRDPVAALREAARVVRPGGRLVAMAWGTAQECEGADLGARPAPSLFDLLHEAGLNVGELRTVACPWRYRDENMALRGLMSAVGLDTFTEPDEVRDAIAPYRRDDGSFVLRNVVHYVVATV